MKIYTLLMVLMVASAGACQNSEKTTQEASVAVEGNSPKAVLKILTPADFAAKKEGDVQLVDVRRPEEFAAGHIEGAVNYNFQGADFNKEVAQLDKNKPVLVYCRSGRRSGAASQKLESMGFTEIYDLKGGYLNWTKTQDEK